MILNFLWDKFGISAEKASKLDAKWVQTMLAVASGQSRAEGLHYKNMEKKHGQKHI